MDFNFKNVEDLSSKDGKRRSEQWIFLEQKNHYEMAMPFITNSKKIMWDFMCKDPTCGGHSQNARPLPHPRLHILEMSFTCELSPLWSSRQMLSLNLNTFTLWSIGGNACTPSSFTTIKILCL